MRTLVVGDIHGGLKGLEQVLERAKVTANDKIIFLGDYVDGWSESAKAVSFLIDFSRSNTCIFLRGNHDDLCHRWLKTNEFNPQWLLHGGQATMDEYEQLSKQEIEAHIDFYDKMDNYHVDSDNRLYVHAGFQNLHGPEMEYHETAFYWDRTLWEMAISLNEKLSKGDPRFPKRLSLFNEIYIGHTPVQRIGKSKPTKAANVWNVDTGAAFKGTVSVIDVENKEFWQSDPVWELYPSEDGRN